MGKYRQKWNSEIYEKWIKEGRGKGQGKDYKPWLTIHSLPSHGLSTRTSGWKTNRVHHFLAKNETRYFYLLEWSDLVVDIQEQFPMLPFDITREIAADMGISYPLDPDSGFPYVLTTDFLITMRKDGKSVQLARSIKPALELEKSEVIERLELERRYWAAKGVDWGIVTENEIPKIMAQNIEAIYSSYWLEPTPEIDLLHLRSLAQILKLKLQRSTSSISQTATLLDQEMNLSPGTCLYLFKHLVAHKEVILDMHSKFNYSRPARSIKAILSEGAYEARSA
jgi:hypothetical protein